MYKITNLTNGPQELEGTDGKIVVGAHGTITGEFHSDYIDLLRGAGVVRIEHISPRRKSKRK